MRKFLAILLAMILVMVSVAAMADEGDNPQPQKSDNPTPVATPSVPLHAQIKDVPAKPTAETTINVTKEYTVEGTNAKTPVHTLTFSVSDVNIENVTKAEATVDGVENTGLTGKPSTTHAFTDDEKAALAVTIGTNNQISITANDIKTDGTVEIIIPIHLPSYSYPGIYGYEITEVDGNIAGIQYLTGENKYYLKVTVTEEAATPTAASVLKISGIALRRGSKDASKVAEIVNNYKAGTLTIDKKVSGNLGDFSKDWNFTVTLTAPNATETTKKSIASIITYKRSTDPTSTPVQPTAWNNGVYTKTFTLKNNESMVFENIPEDVIYTVIEAEAGKEGYSTTINSGTPITGTADDKQWAADEQAKGTIKFDTPATASYTNTKEITPDTGITLETLPYVLMMALAMMGLVVLKLRKREEY